MPEIDEVSQAANSTPELGNQSTEPDGNGVMLKIKADLDALGTMLRDPNRSITILIGTAAYYKILQAAMEPEWKFGVHFDNQRARMFNVPFLVSDERGDSFTVHAE